MKKNGKCSDGVMVPDENDTWQDWLAKKEKQVARIQVREEQKKRRREEKKKRKEEEKKKRKITEDIYIIRGNNKLKRIEKGIISF